MNEINPIPANASKELVEGITLYEQQESLGKAVLDAEYAQSAEIEEWESMITDAMPEDEAQQVRAEISALRATPNPSKEALENVNKRIRAHYNAAWREGHTENTRIDRERERQQVKEEYDSLRRQLEAILKETESLRRAIPRISTDALNPFHHGSGDAAPVMRGQNKRVIHEIEEFIEDLSQEENLEFTKKELEQFMKRVRALADLYAAMHSKLEQVGWRSE